MSVDDNDDKIRKLRESAPSDWQEEGDDDSASGGGQGSGIQFRDFTAPVTHNRDDTLPHDERRRLLLSHKETNELRVKNQKQQREVYKDLKNGKKLLSAIRNRLAEGIQSLYKPSPILVNKAQFSGSTDEKVKSLPHDNAIATNQQKQDELQNKLELQHRHRHTPAPSKKFNPTPFSYGPGGR